MIASMAADRVAEVLAGIGYRQLSIPLQIAGLKFEFTAALIGASRSSDLVLVTDTTVEGDHQILRLIEGVARALDVMRSRRPLTVVLVGPQPQSTVLEGISRVCRVLPISTTIDGDLDATLQNWLAVLMPLQLPEPSLGFADPLSEIANQIKGLPPEVAGLVDLAPQGAAAVQGRFLEIVSDLFANVSRKDEQ